MDHATTGHPRNARADRELRRAGTARALALLLDRHGVTRAEVAAAVGVSPQHVQQWADPEGAKHLTVADAEALPSPALRVALAERIAGPGHVVALVGTSVESHRAVDVSAAATLVRASGAVLDSLLVALADGHLDPAERRDVAARAHELARLAAGLEQALLAGAERRPLRVAG